ncbi:MAG: glycosyltransferase family 39 protein, partial [Syntrophales bacterium]
MNNNSQQRFQINREWQILAVLLLAALVVRYTFFSGGIRGSDAYAYAQYAHDIASGNYDLKSIGWFYGFRYFVLLPTVLCFKIFGVNDQSASIFPYIFSLLNIVVVFYIGKKIFNRGIGIIASGLLIIYPLDVSTANCVSPDSFIPLLSSLAILCYIVAEEKPSFIYRKRFLLLLSGIFISFAYMSRVTSVFLFFALALYQLFHKKYTAFFWTAIGLSVPLITEAIYFYLYTGDPLFEIHRITRLSIAYAHKNDYDLGLLVYPKNMFGFELSGLAMFGFTWWFVAVGLLLLWLRKEKTALLIVVCLLIPFFGFEFGFQSLKEGILIVKTPSCMSLITGPAMIISAYFFYHMFFFIQSKFKTKSIAILTISLLTLISMHLYGTYRLFINSRDDAAPYIAVAEHLIKKPGSTIYIHHFRWPLFLKYFLRYDSSYKYLDLNETSERELNNLSNVYIVFHRRYLETDVRGRPFPQSTIYAKYEK